MITENADDVTVLLNPLEQRCGEEPLIDSLPHRHNGSILFTTRTREATIKLSGNNGSILFMTRIREAAIKLTGNNVIALCELERPEAKEFL